MSRRSSEDLTDSPLEPFFHDTEDHRESVPHALLPHSLDLLEKMERKLKKKRRNKQKKSQNHRHFNDLWVRMEERWGWNTAFFICFVCVWNTEEICELLQHLYVLPSSPELQPSFGNLAQKRFCFDSTVYEAVQDPSSRSDIQNKQNVWFSFTLLRKIYISSHYFYTVQRVYCIL